MFFEKPLQNENLEYLMKLIDPNSKLELKNENSSNRK